MITNQLTIDNP